MASLLPIRRSLQPGTVLHSTYQIVRLVGAGGMGQVYEAQHVRLPGRFAVKVLSGALHEGGAVAFLRFRREAEIASALRHPNIVQIVDFNQMEDGTPYIVMEFIEGQDLSVERGATGRYSPQRTVRIVEQIASGLAAAHAQGIVHRDLKPQNVLLIPSRGPQADFVKIVDFGICKVSASGTAASLTDGAILIGTPSYMAPEQARGHTDDIDGRTDQFALAAITYEMLTGQAAFTGDNVPAILFKIVHGEAPALTGLPDSHGPAIQAVLHRGLSRDKHLRYASVLEFADALTAAVTRGRAPAPLASVGTLLSPVDDLAPKHDGEAAPAETRIQLCGRFTARIAGQRLEDSLRGKQVRMLFAYLVAHRRRPSVRSELIEAVWPDGAPAAPESALSALLTKLKAVLGAGAIVGKQEMRVTLPAPAWVDLEAASEALHRAESAVALGDWARAWGPARVGLHIARRTFLPGVEGRWIDEIPRNAAGCSAALA